MLFIRILLYLYNLSNNGWLKNARLYSVWWPFFPPRHYASNVEIDFYFIFHFYDSLIFQIVFERNRMNYNFRLCAVAEGVLLLFCLNCVCNLSLFMCNDSDFHVFQSFFFLGACLVCGLCGVCLFTCLVASMHNFYNLFWNKQIIKRLWSIGDWWLCLVHFVYWICTFFCCSFVTSVGKYKSHFFLQFFFWVKRNNKQMFKCENMNFVKTIFTNAKIWISWI